MAAFSYFGSSIGHHSVGYCPGINPYNEKDDFPCRKNKNRKKKKQTDTIREDMTRHSEGVNDDARARAISIKAAKSFDEEGKRQDAALGFEY